jgi:hypothetical protein
MQQYFEWGQTTIDSYAQLATTLHDYLPNLISALAFMFIGWLCAVLVRFSVMKLTKVIDRFVTSLGRSLGIAKIKPHRALPSIIANTLYWIIILFFFGTILRSLGWPGLIILIHDYLPRLLGAFCIALAGYVISHLIYYLISNYHGIKQAQYANTLASGAKLIIIVFSISMAIEHLGFNMALFNYLFLIIISFFLLGAALAFGIGARNAISHLLAMRNVRRHYNVGQYVKVDGIEGQVIDIQTHAIVLQTTEGKAIVPGDMFYEKIAILLESKNNE